MATNQMDDDEKESEEWEQGKPKGKAATGIAAEVHKSKAGLGSAKVGEAESARGGDKIDKTREKH